MIKEPCAIFTVCNIAYLPKALVLAESIIEVEKTKINIFIFDKKCNDLKLPDSIAKFTWVEDLGVEDLYQLAFKYDITEFSTSLKAFLALELLRVSDKVVFLDPDIVIYDKLDSIWNDLDLHPIVLTPHYTTPQPSDWPDSDLGMMRFGSFNLGFFAVTDSPEAREFLKWWHNRCLALCYFETQFGLSTDQKWVSIAPCFFPGLHISFNLGYNVAFWNLHERTLTFDSKEVVLVNGKYRLIFFHYSSFDDVHPERLTKRPFPARSAVTGGLVSLSIEYKQRLDRWADLVLGYRYGFDYMSDGSYISPVLRRAYAAVLPDLPREHDPFDSLGVVGVFAKENKLIRKSLSNYLPSGFADLAANERKAICINRIMKFVLFVVGPNRFSNLSRLLVYLSSYRINRSLWKL